jgi:tRNA-uridine 2-sulfurtransferase
MNKKRVMVGMSGGVDSSVAAALLQEKGYEVVGVFFHFWSEENKNKTSLKEKFPTNKCCSTESLFRARQIASWLGIEFQSIDIRSFFKKNIVERYIQSFEKGLTPNPCTTCNKYIKFGIFLDTAKELGCEYVATGHYANISQDIEGVYHLSAGQDITKDQSYFLYTFTQEKMSHILLPLGNTTKKEVYKLAQKYGIDTNYKKVQESQDLCFYAEKKPKDFLMRHLSKESQKHGDIIQKKTGKKIGIHTGLYQYTIGQRKGLDLGGFIHPQFVLEKDYANNILIVGEKEFLQKSTFIIEDVHFPVAYQKNIKNIQICIRYRGKKVSADLHMTTQTEGIIKLHEPLMSITPGQIAVGYNNNELIMGGKIII